MSKIILLVTMLSSGIVLGQFHEISSKILNEGDFSQTVSKSFVYLNDANNLEQFKTDIYNFFDPTINLNPNNYDPNQNLTTTYYFIIYKNTLIINSSLKIEENETNKDIYPYIKNEDNNIAAIVLYSISLGSKQIMFYSNKVFIKMFTFNTEIIIEDKAKLNLE